MPRILPYFSPLARLAQAAVQAFPADRKSAEQDTAWFMAMSPPLGELMAMVAADLEGGPVLGECSLEEAQAAIVATGCNTPELSDLLYRTAGIIDQALAADQTAAPVLGAPDLPGLAERAGVDPTVWITLVTMILQMIQDWRKRRNPQPAPAPA